MYLSVQSFNPCISVIQTSCPYVNGSAVYKARMIYSSLNPLIDYNDMQLCNSAGVYKNSTGEGLFDNENNWINSSFIESFTGKNKIYSATDFLIYPNPTNNEIRISYTLNSNENAELLIYDMLGITKVKIELKPENNIVVVPIHFLNAGVYSYRYLINNEQRETGKLIIE